ncbi:MAG: L,D-transpeptidase [Pseudomonadota bacterium]|nr:L,D-transpeptidase [Pseudomonadota bacterium]
MNRRSFVALAAAGALCAGARKVSASSEHPQPVSAPTPAAVREAQRFRTSPAEYQKVATQFLPQTVTYASAEPPGTIIIDTDQRFLYLILGPGRAKRYGVGVGRQGFAWSGTATIKRKAKWPTWYPPPEMRARDREARRWRYGMPGGSRNPLGARALYLFQGNADTLFRIHGTREPKSIGKAVSSGCVRMLNADVAELFERVPIGTKVVVLSSTQRVAQVRKPRRKIVRTAAFKRRRERRRRKRYFFDWFVFG